MSSESSRRSNLIDVTYLQLHSILSGNQEGIFLEQLIPDYLNPRKDSLKNVAEPFGKPSGASRKKVESGSVTLPDGVVLRVEDADKEFVFAISTEFQIDEIQALILLRSFLYNEGLPPSTDANSMVMVAELVSSIRPFYYSERLSLYRCLIPIFRAMENSSDFIHDIASEFLPDLLPDGLKFAKSVISEYKSRLNDELPQKLNGNPKAASQWAKQMLREQLVLLEVLLWSMWGFVPCSGEMVQLIFETTYSTNLGSSQRNSNLLLDQESAQLQQDCSAMWMLITIEVLELENLGEDDFADSRRDIYISSNDSLKRIHELVTQNPHSQYACTYLAWTYVLSRLSAKSGDGVDNPPAFQPFLDSLAPPMARSYTKDREQIHVQMSKVALDPDVGLFRLIHTLLTSSPLFVTAIAWKTGSSVTDPNAIAFRSVMKGLIIGLVELVPVELIPEVDLFVDVWIALFGRSESLSIAGICTQFWQSDWNHGISRRAIFDVARSRFPIHIRPLFRLLRSMTAAGFLDTDPLSTVDHASEGEALTEERDLCDRYVFHYLQKLPTYSQVIQVSACTGAHALYERQQERYGSNNGLTYVNLRPIKLPGGSILPARSTGRLLSGDGGDSVVVCWNHEHSGWKFILEILTDFVNRRRNYGMHGSHQEVNFRRRVAQPLTLQLQDIGVEVDDEGDETLITDALDLVRSLIQDNPGAAEDLMQALEAGEPVVSHTMTEAQPPDLVQLTTMILEEALSRSNVRERSASRTHLITSAMSVLSALLALPNYSNRVWLYMRSTSVLFGSDRNSGFSSKALEVERANGHYTMTLALLYLVQQLFREASSTILPDNPKLQQLKEEVLLRASRFVHTEIWVEHLGWKYAQLGDRFEIGRRVSSLYVEVLEHAPPSLSDRPFLMLSRTVADLLLFKATTSTIHPLISSISSGGRVLRSLYASRRFGDARRLIYLLESHLRLCRLLLNHKQRSPAANKLSLLEQALCSRISGSATLGDDVRTALDPIDVLAGYVKDRDVGAVVPLESMRLLYALCASLSSSPGSPPTIIGHLSNPEATVASLVRIVQHPYDELSLRNAIWNFISLAIDREPALASLFVTGRFHTPVMRQVIADDKSKPTSAISVAHDVLENWKSLWEANPQLLASVFKFLDVVWAHGLEHKPAVEPLRQDAEFWDQIVAIACEEIGPVPDTSYSSVEGIRHSAVHEAVTMHSYRTFVKSYAVQIIAADIGIQRQLHVVKTTPLEKPVSFTKLDSHFKSEDELTDLLSEAIPSSYAPQLYDELVELLKANFVGLTLEQLESQEPEAEREYGECYAFSVPLLLSRIHAYPHGMEEMENPKDLAERQLLSINLNLSLTYSQTALTRAWDNLLHQVIPYLRGDETARPILLSISTSISHYLASEERRGDMMASIHGTRLSLLLAVLELAWFSFSDTPEEVQSFVELVKNLHLVICNDMQPPRRSMLGAIPAPFHRVLLQIMYFCFTHARILINRPKTLNAEQRLTIAATIDSTLALVIKSLTSVFLIARTKQDVEIDKDMQLLVAVFDLCTRPDLNTNSTFWLGLCQETDIIRASLELFTHTDIVGLSDISGLLMRKQPLYAQHILYFHMALVGNPTAAERFAGEGALAAYCNNSISTAISSGRIDVTIPELPGERSPAHQAYCSMLSIVATIIRSLGQHNHYFDTEACGFVQLYGDQISRALSWTIGDPITFPLVEEIELVVHLFYSIAASAPTAANVNPSVEKVLRVFTKHALYLLQQLNYAITHPHHLSSLFEAVEPEDRIELEHKNHQAGDPLKRPLVAHLLHKLFRTSANVMETLVSISRADTILLTTPEDWPIGEALVLPHSKVVPGEPASLGTLLELGNGTLDLLRDLTARPAGQSLTRTPMSSIPTTYHGVLDVREGVITGRRNLEAILFYAVTQLAMWLSKPEYDASSIEADTMDEQVDVHTMQQRPERRSSITMAERLRRGMTGEMASDLQALLNKSKPVLEKSAKFLDVKSVDIIPVLSNFLRDRVSLPS